MAFKRRAGIPNWSSEVHVVQSTRGKHVADEKGKTQDTRLVLPVTATSSVPFPSPERPRILVQLSGDRSGESSNHDIIALYQPQELALPR